MSSGVDDSMPDAVRVPIRRVGPGDARQKLARLHAEFARVLRADRIQVRNQGDEHFLTAGVGETLSHPGDGPHSGQSRYEWHDRGDGVFYGFRPVGGPD